MRVLVTGAAGLYGVHLVDELVRRDDVEQIIGIDDFSREYFEKDPFIKSEDFKRKFRLIEGKYYDLTLEEIDKMDLDIVVHLAAYISIPESMERQEEYFKNNEYGTFRFVQTLLRSKNWPLLVYASSPEVYGNPLYTPMDINHPMLPRSIYAVTKLAAEKHCYAMYQWYRYPVIVMRNFNTFGENQDVSGNAGVVSNFLVRALRGEPLVVHNRGEQTRDFQYVKDAVRAYLSVIEKRDELIGEIFNIGTGKQVSIKKLAEMVLRITDSSSTIVYQQGRAADLISLEADYSEIKGKTGWTPRYSLEEGLRRTAKWYKRYIK